MSNIPSAVAPPMGHFLLLQPLRWTFFARLMYRCPAGSRLIWGSSFDLDADQLGVAADVKVVVLDVSQPVGEVQHGAVRKLDVELFHVEVDVALKGDIRL